MRITCAALPGATPQTNKLTLPPTRLPHRYHGSWLKGSNLWIVMEYCSGGSCSDLMKPGRLREDYIAIVMRELLKGLDYLHAQGKLHRDIKGERRAVRSGDPTTLTLMHSSHTPHQLPMSSSQHQATSSSPTLASLAS